jgi:hypothetical protein
MTFVTITKPLELVSWIHDTRLDRRPKMTVKRYAVHPDGTPYESPQGRIYICDQCGEQGWDSPEHSEDCPKREEK